MLNEKRTSAWILLFFLLAFLNKIATPEEKDNFKPKYSIKLTCGMGYSAIGDINKTLESFNNNSRFESARLNTPDLINGEIVALENRNLDLEAEFRLHISPKIALSFATSSPVIKKNESSLTYIYRGSAGDQIHSYNFKPEVKVWMPLRVSFGYSLYSSSKLNLFFYGGINYYIIKASEFRRFELIPPVGSSDRAIRYWETKNKIYSGLHGGIEIDYNLIKNMAFVLEVEGKYARIGYLKGTMLEETDFFEFGQEGFLYFFNMWDDYIGVRYDDLKVWYAPPEFSTRDYTGIKKAVLDLSGFSFKVGIRIRLF
ncbi:MAG: hypothetical protein OEY25_02755 [Candidatus Aminicenantes bacterium]|nr:hypothetical protein [Candidatus Aminicenantes bacterium]MDH5706441.1 hypothetical protein [Candidatus Aminicenantes bacterium]